MVSKEGEPTFGRVRISRRSFHPTGDRSLGEIKTEHEEFPMYPRRSPGCVLGNHLEDQLSSLLRRPSSSNLRPDSGDQPPIHTKTSPVPTDYGFRCDDEQTKARTAMPTFEHSELLPEQKILQYKIPTATEEANQCSDPEENEAEHG